MTGLQEKDKVKRAKKELNIPFLILGILFSLPVLGLINYSLLPLFVFDTEGWVKDAETGKPISEAVVIMDWPNAFGLMDNVEFATLERREVVTDDNGHFVVPGWFKIWPLYKYWDTAYFGVYAAGYYPKSLKDRPRNPFIPLFWWSRWDGKTIELQPMHWREWTKEEWEKQIKKHEYLWAYGRIPADNGCGWMKVPHNVIEDIRFDIRRKELVDRSMVVAEEIKEILINAKDNCGVDVFQYLSQFGLTPEEWKACCSK